MSLRPIPAGSRYRVILADPPWQYQQWSAKGENKSAAKHYPLMSFEELEAFAKTIGLDFICEPHCVLFLWATFPMLRQAFKVIDAWGFEYSTGGGWGKTTSAGKLSVGTGYILRGALELWLVAGRSIDDRSACAPAVHDVRNLFMARTQGHSRKPDNLHEAIERMYPGGRYLELFARRRRPGWDAYGDELGGFVPAEQPFLAAAE